MTVRRLSIEGIGLAAALVATVVMYVFFIVHPQEHTPLAAFLAMFERGNAAVWPMQLVWYASAAAIVGLALWPIRRASQLICLLAAAYLAWVGIAYFGVLFSGTHRGGLRPDPGRGDHGGTAYLARPHVELADGGSWVGACRDDRRVGPRRRADDGCAGPGRGDVCTDHLGRRPAAACGRTAAARAEAFVVGEGTLPLGQADNLVPRGR
jgi:hypothetical protein